MSTPHTPPRYQGVTLWLLFVAWSWSTLVLPLCHGLDHRDDHEHGANGTVYFGRLVAEHSHCSGEQQRSREPTPGAHEHGAGHSHAHRELHPHAAGRGEQCEDANSRAKPPHRREQDGHGSSALEHLHAALILPSPCQVPAYWTGELSGPEGQWLPAAPGLDAPVWARRSRAPPLVPFS